MTKKELLEAIKDMPEDAEIWVECDLWYYKAAESVFYDKDDETLNKFLKPNLFCFIYKLINGLSFDSFIIVTVICSCNTWLTVCASNDTIWSAYSLAVACKALPTITKYSLDKSFNIFQIERVSSSFNLAIGLFATITFGSLAKALAISKQCNWYSVKSEVLESLYFNNPTLSRTFKT